MTAGADAFLETVTFDGRGLVPVIAQAAGSGEVLMMAWMNAESIREDSDQRSGLLLVAFQAEALAQGRNLRACADLGRGARGL